MLYSYCYKDQAGARHAFICYDIFAPCAADAAKNARKSESRNGNKLSHCGQSAGWVNCSPTLDQAAGLFPGSSSQRGPYAADRPISSTGGLLPIAL
jgi:hypothetical protein